MRQTISVVMLVGVIALLGLSAQAKPGPTVPGGGSVRSFLPVYQHYASALDEHGLDGFKSVTAPSFTINHGHEHWTGAAAFALASTWLTGIQGGKVTVTLRHLIITGHTAVALTLETLTFRLTPNATGTGTTYWKQTWRQVGSQWKLASVEAVSEKAFGPTPPIEYTVSG